MTQRFRYSIRNDEEAYFILDLKEVKQIGPRFKYWSDCETFFNSYIDGLDDSELLYEPTRTT